MIDPEGVRIATLRGDGAGVQLLYRLPRQSLVSVQVGNLANFLPSSPNFQPPAGMLFRPGGIVIKQGEEVIGAIGVGGAPAGDKDQACAQTGIDKIKERIR